MRIAIGSDHAVAYEFKNELIPYITALGHTVVDVGTYSLESCDYTDFGLACANLVTKKECDLGIVICTTGIGMSIICNKVRGIRCALVTDITAARLTKEHNNSNVLALGAGLVTLDEAKEIVKTWISTPFSNNERHVRRVNKIIDYENNKL